jgi:hypothetical protein
MTNQNPNLYEKICQKKLTLEIKINTLTAELDSLIGCPRDVMAIDYTEIKNGKNQYIIKKVNYDLMIQKKQELEKYKSEYNNLKQAKLFIENEFINSGLLTKGELLILKVKNKKLKSGERITTTKQIANHLNREYSYIRHLNAQLNKKMKSYIENNLVEYITKI